VEEDNSPLTKDQRTIFVSQLVMRAEERDLRRYFRSVIGRSSSCVKDVILLRDKRTGRHKGIAYVELARLSHVPTAVAMNGQVPDFQRFPILIKANHPTPQDSSLSSPMTAMMGGALLPGSTPGMIMTNTTTSSTPLLGTMLPSSSSLGMMVGGVQHVAQKVYVGNIDRAVTQAQLYALFSQFGPLDKVLLQMDPATGLSKGFAFLTFPDPNIAYLAIQTMSGQPLAGRPL
jgi:RNA-binding protein 39